MAGCGQLCRGAWRVDTRTPPRLCRLEASAAGWRMPSRRASGRELRAPCGLMAATLADGEPPT
eukprot:715802-Heterocapsa_arctica.AAC.1